MDHHKPVLRDEALESLAIVPNGIYIDGTFGRGGHSEQILSCLDADGQLIAIDADPQAVEFAKQRFADDERFFIVHDNFANLGSICREREMSGRVNGVLLDLGVSSPQLDDPERGFSFMQDGPLDMRMDPNTSPSAREWVASADEAEMSDVFWQYGEERYSRRIARALVLRRAERPFESTLDFAEAIKTAHPRWEKNKHPATRVFQAVRIFINREMDVLKRALDSVVEVLSVGGRLVVISFHSLEDRLVKRFIRGPKPTNQRLRGMQLAEEVESWSLRSAGKAIRAGSNEVAGNPRSRSAVLRVTEKIA